MDITALKLQVSHQYQVLELVSGWKFFLNPWPLTSLLGDFLLMIIAMA